MAARPAVDEGGKTGSVEQLLEEAPVFVVFKTIINILGNRGEHAIQDKHGSVGRRDIERGDFGFFVDEVIAVFVEGN